MSEISANRDDPKDQHLHVSHLPALPTAWPDGSAKGLRTRGGFEVDLTWKSGKLTAATIRNHAGTSCKIAYAGKSIDLKPAPGSAVELDGELGRK